MRWKIVLHISRVVALSAIGAGILLFQECDKKYPYDEVLKRNSDEMNKKCPLTIDEGTRLDSTSAGPGRRFTYCYTLTRQVVDSIDVKSLNANLRPLLIGNLKTNMVYRFFDRKGRFVLSIPIMPEDYGR